MATVPKFGLAKTILFIVFLIVLVQMFSIYYFSTLDGNLSGERTRRTYHDGIHERDFVYTDDDNNYNINRKDDNKETINILETNKNHVFSTDKVGRIFSSSPLRCTAKHKDAISALRRVKSMKCKNKLYETICLSQEDKLYWNNITRYCPVERSKGRPSHAIQAKIGYGPPIRILYAMVVHGRAFRQVKRLFKALFHTNHYFYFHVDSRSDYLHREVQELVKKYSNAVVAPWRMATIWGGASLLQMLLRMMADSLKMKHWKWDFFLNLSASDYPVQSNEKLSSFLRAHREENFLKPHGGKVERFVKKQGLSRTFFECDEHMWRLGDRKLPENIDFDGGSDWICLNHKFVDYVVNSQDLLMTGLKHLYQYALLPAESFFHVALRNSASCQTFAKGNLRLTNWKRKLGCRCQYKHIVDWCGCSPNNFKPEDLVRLQSQTINHFARKFEPIVNNEILNILDNWLYGKATAPLVACDRYWENFYHFKDDNITKFDIFMTYFQSFARITSRSLSITSGCQFIPIWKSKEATYLNRNDTFEGVLTLFDLKIMTDAIQRDFVSIETFFKPKSFMKLFNKNMTEPANRLKSLYVGINWDQKERIFRNIASLIGPTDNPTLVHRWVHGPEFFVRIVWQDPLNVIAGMYQMKVEKNWVISFHKPNFSKPLRPGTWTVKIVYNDDVVLGLNKFLVVPRAYFSGKEASLEDVIPTNNGPPAGLYSSDFVVEFDREANNTQQLVKDFSKSSSSIGSHLGAWIDKHILQHWDYIGSCVVVDKRFRKCGGINSCREIEWSSRSSDPKSEIGNINSAGRLR